MLREMAEQLALDLVSKKLMTDQIVLTVGYDIENLTDPARRNRYHGPIVKDHYGREVPKHAHGTERLGWPLCPCQPAQWKLQQHTRFCNGCVG